jgi:surface antigen
MTSIGAAASGLLTYTNAGTTYARTVAASDPLVAAVTGDDSNTSATNVTLSPAALAALSAQGADATSSFATVTTNARATLDQLLAAAKVTTPLNNGQPTIDLSSLDSRSLFAIASNSQGIFSADEQSVAGKEAQNRFDAMIKPRLAASDLTGNYNDVYKAAADYFDNMSPEQKATPAWTAQRTAIDQGLQATKLKPSALPTGIANDPVADFVTRSANNTTAPDPTNFSSVASSARAQLDAQATAAKRAGTQLALTPQSKGQQVDWSGFNAQSLSSIVLNQGTQFSPQEVRSAKTELDSRNRASILQAFQQSQSSGDPRALSYSLLTQYSSMSPEQLQASNWTSSFRDTAVANYKSASNLLSMIGQVSGSDSSSSSGSSGSSTLDFLSAMTSS